MASSIKIPDDEMQRLREAARINNRSLAGQVVHWMRLARAVESNPNMTLTRVQRALKGELDLSELNDDEQELFFDRLGEVMAQPSAQEEAFCAQLRQDLAGFEVDENDNLVVRRAGMV